MRLALCGISVLLWLVEPELPRPPLGFDGLQLCIGLCDWPRGARSKTRQRTLAADICVDREPISSRLFQICRFLRRNGKCVVWISDRVWSDHSAARNFLLHVYADRIPGRRVSREDERAEFRPLASVRDLFSASHRRPHHPSRPRHAAIRQAGYLPDQLAERLRRAHGVRDRSHEKALHGRQFRGYRDTDLFGGARRSRTAAGRSVGRRARIHASTVFRFLRIFGYGDRIIAAFQHQASVQLQLAVQGIEHHRFLATLAYDVVGVPARLPLYSARRQPQRNDEALCQSSRDHAARRALAWSFLDLCRLGRLAWRLSDDKSWISRRSRSGRIERGQVMPRPRRALAVGSDCSRPSSG
jgi:hypothetical protein